MSKGLKQSLAMFSLPLGMVVVGSLSLVVWSQKPAVSAVAAAPAPIAVSAEEVASFDPFKPTAQVVAAAPAVSAPTQVVAGAIAGTEMGPSLTGHMGTVSLGSNAQPVNVVTKETTSVATRTAEDFKLSAVASDSSGGGTDNAVIYAKTATITVGDAVINILSSAKINTN